MHKSKLKRVTFAVWLAMVSVAAEAAGLGKMSVSSSLGEPLRAEIELLSVSSDELSALSAAIAPVAAYSAQGVERTSLHGSIKIDVAKKGDGTHVLRLSTAQPVNDPYLDMLIQVDWNSGRLIREYTALLDPPGYSSNSNAPNIDTQENKRSARNTNAGQDVLIDVPDRPGKNNDKKSISKVRSVSDHSANDEYKVKRGDTLLGIARQKSASNVSLDQMLLGLYKANTNAFIGGNINRLKVGQILRIPANQEVSAIDKQEASKEIQAQVANWNAYRNNMADAVAGSEALGAEVARKTASGKISKLAEEHTQPLAAGSRDIVKLSKGDTASNKKAGEVSTQALQNALQEDAIANERKITEANERIVALTKQLEDMQKLLELKGQAMADLQKLAEKSAIESKKSAEQESSNQPMVATDPVPKPNENSASKAVVKPPKTTVQAPPVTAQTAPIEPSGGLVDILLENAAWIGAAGGALILSIGGWLFLRNRRMHNLDKFEQDILTTGGLNAKTVFGSTSGGTIDTGDTSFLTAFTHGSGAMIDTHDVDPLAEAEVYMAYGREIQAEEILKDAIKKEPTRFDLSLKLLEIYAGRKDSSAFDAIAGELYSTLGANHPIWLKVAEIGHEMEPDNPLYQTATISESPVHKLENNSNGSIVSSLKNMELDNEDNSVELKQEQNKSLEWTEGVQEESISDFDTDSVPAVVNDLEVDSEENQGEDALSIDTNELEVESNNKFLEPKFAENEINSLDYDDSADVVLDMPDLQAPGFQVEESKPESVLDEEVTSENKLTENISANERGATGEDPFSIFDEAAVETINLELPVLDSSLETDAVIAAQETETKAEVTDDLNFDFNISFDNEVEKGVNTPAQAAVDKLPELGLTDINLDFGTPEDQSANEQATQVNESSEVDTKLDLVTAYIDMDDKEGARELLDEVLLEGGPQQRQRAQRILDSLE